MAGRLAASLLTVILLLSAAVLLEAPISWADVPQGAVEFQDGSGGPVESVTSARRAVFYVRDSGLATVHGATAAWSDVPSQVPANSPWSLATGAPHPGSYALGTNSAYETGAPSNTPLASVPSASVDGVAFLLSSMSAATGGFALLNDVDTSSSVVIAFSFDIVDVYPAESHRARITGTADPGGEWVTLSEVASETDSSPSPTSGLFRGEVALSGHVAALDQGNGIVWARPGDTLTAAYFGPSGETVVAADQVQVATPTPAVLPSVGWVAIAMLAGAFGLLGWLRASGRGAVKPTGAD